MVLFWISAIEVNSAKLLWATQMQQKHVTRDNNAGLPSLLVGFKSHEEYVRTRAFRLLFWKADLMICGIPVSHFLLSSSAASELESKAAMLSLFVG